MNNIDKELQVISEKELKILEFVRNNSKEFSIDPIPKMNDTFIEYKNIYESYLKLLTENENSLEALKRLIFIQWYACAEPHYLAGIFGLNKNSELRVLQYLDRVVEYKRFDLELHYMRAWYYKIADYYFIEHLGLDKKTKDFMACDSVNLIKQAKPIHQDFENRGQMGHYWISINLRKLYEK